MDRLRPRLAGDSRARRHATRGDRPAAAPARSARAAPICRRTGLRAGDLVRVWPYDGDAIVVAGTIVGSPLAPAWVVLANGVEVPAERVRLAAFACPVCGICAGPAVERPVLRPCPECLVDLRRLEAHPAEAARIRTAIEARAQAGVAEAGGLGDERLVERARDRVGWARRLRSAPPRTCTPRWWPRSRTPSIAGRPEKLERNASQGGAKIRFSR